MVLVHWVAEIEVAVVCLLVNTKACYVVPVASLHLYGVLLLKMQLITFAARWASVLINSAMPISPGPKCHHHHQDLRLGRARLSVHRESPGKLVFALATVWIAHSLARHSAKAKR
jgi:hypothetical protein